MRVIKRARAHNQPRVWSWTLQRPRNVALALGLSLLVAITAAPAVGAQDDASADRAHSLDVTLNYPDEGLITDEQLCVALFADANPDLSQTPLLSRCLDPGGDAVTFEGLRSGEYSVLLPGPGTDLDVDRYQGQLVGTSIPKDSEIDDFGIDVDVALAPEFAGTTGRVQVSVFGCPAGTNAGGDKDGWAAECQAIAGGIPLTLSGTGSIHDAAFQAVTGLSGDTSGRVEFSNLPAGAYELDGDLPRNVGSDPALFAESSIDGSLGSLDPSATLALRPTETVAVDVYLVLSPEDQEPVDSSVGLNDVEIIGEVPEE